MSAVPPPIPATEAEKLRAFQRILNSRKFVVSQMPHAKKEVLAWCSSVLQDLIEGKNVEIIEPDIRAASYDDPALKPFQAQCPQVELHRCEVNHGEAVSYATRNFQVFQLDLDGRADTPKHFLFYAEDYRIVFGRSACPAKYELWDLKQCVSQDVVLVSDDFRNGYVYDNHHALVRVRGRIAVLDVHELGVYPTRHPRYGFNVDAYDLRSGRLNPTCLFSDEDMEGELQRSIEKVREHREGKDQ